MRKSLTVSFLMHAAILLAGMVGLPSAKRFEVDQVESVPVDILSVDEFTRLRAQTKEAKPEPEPEPEKEPEREAVRAPEPEPKPQQAALEPEPAPEPEPEPEPAPVPEAKPEPKPEKQAKTPSAPRPRAKPRRIRTMKLEKPKKKKSFDPDRIAALLNKIPDAERRRRQAEESATPSPGAADVPRGSDQVVTLDERNALRMQIERCWSPPVGLANAEDMVVTLRIRLKPDGSLQGAPAIVNSGASEYFRIAAESAVRAVRRCQPFQMPAHKYGAWREIILNFDPKEMFRG